MAGAEAGVDMTDPILTFEEVTHRFGGLVAVDDCTFSVAPGELVGLVGPNGAGKSTLFNLASGYLDPSEGRVLMGEVDTSHRDPAELSQLGLGRTFQTPVSFPELTVLDNVVVGAPSERLLMAGILGSWRNEEARRMDRAKSLLERVGLEDRIDVAAAELSGGELRMLEVARQLIVPPHLLLLDEPTAGVSPHLQGSLADLIRSVHDDGVAVVVVEHNLGFLLDLVDRVICMAHGAIIADGTPEEIRNDPHVVAAYLGEHT